MPKKLFLAFQVLVGLPWAAADTPADRAAALVANMTLEEKLSLVHGYAGLYTGNVPGIDRLGVPALKMNDGPQGFRDDLHPGTTTAWPAALTVAATWDPALAFAWGSAMGEEFRGKGANVQLGPGLNVARVPKNGRNFEYLSGEDPLLGAVIGPQVVQGIQSQGVIANAKHFIFNNQETDRFGVNALVPERVQHEVYLPPFGAAVGAGVGSVMCSYNRITSTADPQPGNASWACEHKDTLTASLKEHLHFQGFVMSDWGATHSTNESALNGLDQEMPSDTYFGDALADAVANGWVPESIIDDKATRILTPMYAVGLMDGEFEFGSVSENVTSPEHTTLARDLAAAATVLLKNEPLGTTNAPLLPLDATSDPLRVVVLGAAAQLNPIIAGTGSGRVLPSYVSTGLAAIEEVIEGQNGGTVSYHPLPTTPALAEAAVADVAVVFVGTTSGEGSDRTNLTLPEQDDATVAAVLAVQPNTVAVVSNPGAMVFGDWIDSIPAVLVQFLPGQEQGHACADVLFGTVNPSAKLPLTFPCTDNEVGLTTAQYPGVVDEYDPPDDCDQPCLMANYSEGLAVGHREYALRGLEPKFPFGFGLTYTTFTYPEVSHWIVSFGPRVLFIFFRKEPGSPGWVLAARAGLVQVEWTDTAVRVVVHNGGARDGSDVLMLFVDFPQGYDEPPHRMIAFEKVFVGAGQNASAWLNFTTHGFSYWDTDVHDWVEVFGTFHATVAGTEYDLDHSAQGLRVL